MQDLTSRSFKAAAASALAGSDHKKITGLYTLVYLGLGLLVALSSLVANTMIENTGGLGDMGTRAVISTAEMVLTMAAQIFMPFWTMGFTFCAIGFARNKAVVQKDLLGGLARWPVLVRLFLCYGIVYMAVSYVILLVLLPLYMMTPQGAALSTLMDTAMMDTTALTPELRDQLMVALKPIYAIWIPLLLAILAFLSYLFRLAIYRVLDEDRPGAVRAMIQSCRLLHRHRLRLLRLDLSFWWYHLLTLLLTGILWLPDLMAMAGITVPLAADQFYLLCCGVYALATAVLYLTSLAKVETTYAVFYDRLLHLPRPQKPRPEPPVLKPTHNDPNLPWI